MRRDLLMANELFGIILSSMHAIYHILENVRLNSYILIDILWFPAIE